MNHNPDSALDPAGLHTLEVISKAGKFNHWMYNEIRSYLKGEVLEIGSGIGNISDWVIRDGFSVTLSDYNPGYCEWLKKKFALHEKVKAILQIDLLHTDFSNQYREMKEKFDSIFLLNVIEHLQDDTTAIRNCSQLLKSGGHLIILAPAGKWLYCKLDKELGHYKRYTRDEIEKLFVNEKYTILKSHYFNFTGIWGWFFFGKILRKRLLGNEMAAFNTIVPVAKWLDKLIFKKAGLSVIVAGKKKNTGG